MEDVAVLHLIALALGAHLARLLGRGLPAETVEIRIGDRLRPDEAALEIAVRTKRLPATVSPMPFVPHR